MRSNASLDYCVQIFHKASKHRRFLMLESESLQLCSCLVGSFGASGLHLWDQGLKRPSLIYLQYYLDHQFLISNFSLILIPNRETSSLEMYFTLEQLQHCSKVELVLAGLLQDSAHFRGSLRRFLRSRHFHFTHFRATKQYANWGKLRRFANIFMKTILKSVTWS